MNRFKNLYDEKYSKISIYVIKTTLLTFVFGTLLFHISTKLGVAFSFAGSVLKPFFLGMALAYILEPLVNWLQEKPLSKIKNKRKRKTLSVILTFLLVVLVIVGILTALIITVTRSISVVDFNDLVNYLEVLEKDFSEFWKVVEAKLAEFDINLGSVGSILSKVFNNVSSGASTLLFANIFAVYFLLDSNIKRYWLEILYVFASDSTIKKLKELGQDSDRVFSGYIRGQSLDALLVGVFVSITLLIVGVPYAVVIGLLTGIGNLIPYVGPIVGFGSLIIVCLSEGSMTHLIIGGIILAVVMAIDGNVINPILLSDNVEVHPALVVLALIAGGQIGGIVGMLLAVPVAALLKLQFDKLVKNKRKQKYSKNSTVS